MPNDSSRTRRASRAKSSATRRGPSTAARTGHRNQRALRDFIEGRTILLVRSDSPSTRLVRDGLLLRVVMAGPDWLALSAKL